MPATLRDSQVVRALRAVEGEVGATDRKRLEELTGLLRGGDGRIRLSEALKRLFPDFSDEDALTRFRQLRARLRQAAEAACVELELVVDTQKRSSPDERWCWFEGESLAAVEAERLSRDEALGGQPAEPIRQEALVQIDRPVLSYFVSYARGDTALKEDLLERLERRFDLSTEFHFEGWHDGDILVGEDWKAEIERAIERCHFGLLLISHEFLASRFISEEELPHFVATDPGDSAARRLAVPVELKDISFDDSINLKGLKKPQVFRHSGGSYYKLRAEHTRDAFAEELFQQILAVARKYIVGPEGAMSAGRVNSGRSARRREPAPAARSLRLPHAPDRSLVLTREQRFYLEETGDSPEGIVPTEGVPTHLSKEAGERRAGERVDALGYLESWLRRPDAPPFCALLGEYGMGKTTTCKALTLRLLDAREEDASLPLPIYLDLRHLGDVAKSEPTLSIILDTVVRKSWHSGREVVELAAPEIVRLVQEKGALAIFDGLDEVLVHLSPAAGQRFTRELWRILPPAVFRRRRNGMATSRDGGAADSVQEKDGRRAGRLLISCRTHYFRTLREQATHFTGEGREGISSADYQALLLLPFSEEQIREYLRRNLPDQDLERLLEVMGSVHDLQELAERPYTLSLIAGRIGDLERRKMEGRKITGVTLYQSVVQSWLERDAGKHQLTPDHKQRLMEHLAAALWRSGSRTWNVSELEQWLIDFMEANPRFSAHYHGKDREILKEDLRTATFIVREAQADFCFAHTSLQEFFLASWLYRGLVDARPETWAMAAPNAEVFGFLSQLIEQDESGAAVKGLQALRETYRSQASELALRYYIYVHRHQLPCPALRGFHLEAADLRGLRLSGSEGRKLDLVGAILDYARLDDARIYNVDLRQASLVGTTLDRAELIDVTGTAADFGGASLIGCRFRNSDLRSARFFSGRFHQTEFLYCNLSGADGLEPRDLKLLFADCKPEELYGPDPSLKEAARRIVQVKGGHVDEVLLCRFFDDGRKIASLDWGSNVHIWDVQTGESILILDRRRIGGRPVAFSADGSKVLSLTDNYALKVDSLESPMPATYLKGHSDLITAWAFSYDGSMVVSASQDGTLRLWDSSTGEEIEVGRVGADSVAACTFTRNGERIVTADRDGMLSVWDGSSLTPISATSIGGRVRGACAFSVDGRKFALANDRNEIVLWCVETGGQLVSLEGHGSLVLDCCFSIDGRRLVSAGLDRRLCVWDTLTGHLLVAIPVGWADPNVCAFSPDGHRIVSGGDDGVLSVWDSHSGHIHLYLSGHEVRLTDCTFSRAGSDVFAVSAEGTLVSLDTESGEPVWMYPRDGRRSNAIYAFSANSSRILCAKHDGRWEILDARSGEVITVHGVHRSTACALSPGGDTILTVEVSGVLKLRDSRSGEVVRELHGHDGWVRFCGFSDDGSRILSASGSVGRVFLWEAETGTALLEYETGGYEVFALSPDGSMIASGGDDCVVQLWKVNCGGNKLALEGHEGDIRACVFSSDGSRLMSASSDHTVRVWDCSSGAELLVLEGHQGAVNDCCFSLDGRTIVSVGNDGTLRFWSADTGREVGPRAYAFKDSEFAVISEDSAAILWSTLGAWRWLVWKVGGEGSRGSRVLPAEVFGALPHPRALAKQLLG